MYSDSVPDSVVQGGRHAVGREFGDGFRTERAGRFVGFHEDRFHLGVIRSPWHAVLPEAFRQRMAVHIDLYIGQRVYLHTLALGKAILAHLPRERVEEIIEEHGLLRETDLTITDRDELYDELEESRSRGIAFGPDERLQGLHGIATPIKNINGDVLGSISVAGPSKRIFEETE